MARGSRGKRKKSQKNKVATRGAPNVPARGTSFAHDNRRATEDTPLRRTTPLSVAEIKTQLSEKIEKNEVKYGPLSPSRAPLPLGHESPLLLSSSLPQTRRPPLPPALVCSKLLSTPTKTKPPLPRGPRLPTPPALSGLSSMSPALSPVTSSRSAAVPEAAPPPPLLAWATPHLPSAPRPSTLPMPPTTPLSRRKTSVSVDLTVPFSATRPVSVSLDDWRLAWNATQTHTRARSQTTAPSTDRNVAHTSACAQTISALPRDLDFADSFCRPTVASSEHDLADSARPLKQCALGAGESSARVEVPAPPQTTFDDPHSSATTHDSLTHLPAQLAIQLPVVLPGNGGTLQALAAPEPGGQPIQIIPNYLTGNVAGQMKPDDLPLHVLGTVDGDAVARTSQPSDPQVAADKACGVVAKALLTMLDHVDTVLDHDFGFTDELHRDMERVRDKMQSLQTMLRHVAVDGAETGNGGEGSSHGWLWRKKSKSKSPESKQLPAVVHSKAIMEGPLETTHGQQGVWRSFYFVLEQGTLFPSLLRYPSLQHALKRKAASEVTLKDASKVEIAMRGRGSSEWRKFNLDIGAGLELVAPSAVICRQWVQHLSQVLHVMRFLKERLDCPGTSLDDGARDDQEAEAYTPSSPRSSLRIARGAGSYIATLTPGTPSDTTHNIPKPLQGARWMNKDRTAQGRAANTFSTQKNTSLLRRNSQADITALFGAERTHRSRRASPTRRVSNWLRSISPSPSLQERDAYSRHGDQRQRTRRACADDESTPDRGWPRQRSPIRASPLYTAWQKRKRRSSAPELHFFQMQQASEVAVLSSDDQPVDAALTTPPRTVKEGTDSLSSAHRSAAGKHRRVYRAHVRALSWSSPPRPLPPLPPLTSDVLADCPLLAPFLRSQTSSDYSAERSRTAHASSDKESVDETSEPHPCEPNQMYRPAERDLEARSKFADTVIQGHTVPSLGLAQDNVTTTPNGTGTSRQVDARWLVTPPDGVSGGALSPPDCVSANTLSPLSPVSVFSPTPRSSHPRWPKRRVLFSERKKCTSDSSETDVTPPVAMRLEAALDSVNTIAASRTGNGGETADHAYSPLSPNDNGTTRIYLSWRADMTSATRRGQVDEPPSTWRKHIHPAPPDREPPEPPVPLGGTLAAARIRHSPQNHHKGRGAMARINARSRHEWLMSLLLHTETQTTQTQTQPQPQPQNHTQTTQTQTQTQIQTQTQAQTQAQTQTQTQAKQKHQPHADAHSETQSQPQPPRLSQKSQPSELPCEVRWRNVKLPKPLSAITFDKMSHVRASHAPTNQSHEQSSRPRAPSSSVTPPPPPPSHHPDPPPRTSAAIPPLHELTSNPFRSSTLPSLSSSSDALHANPRQNCQPSRAEQLARARANAMKRAMAMRRRKLEKAI